MGKYSGSGLTALSIIYPVQLLMIALAGGTGVGINTIMAAKLGTGKAKEADEYAGVGTPLAIVMWFMFALICGIFMPFYAKMSTNSQSVIKDVIIYGRIVCIFGLGLFLESIWTKVLQSAGDMKTPMIAQIIGAITNIVLDPLLIFGLFGLPECGIAGVAIATVAGQFAAALIVMKKGFRKAPAKKYIPIILQKYLNSECQTFFFIPLGATQTCIVPVISYNYAAHNADRCQKTLRASILFGLALMALGTLCFVLIPEQMIKFFHLTKR